MPEYLEFRCCMCPQKNSSSQVCPGIPGSLHPEPTPCRFVKRYKDKQVGIVHFVGPGRSEPIFGTYCQEKICDPYPWRRLPWQFTFDEAQRDLNAEAKKRGWQEADGP